MEEFEGEAGFSGAATSADATDGDGVGTVTPGETVLPQCITAGKVSDGVGGAQEVEILVASGIELSAELGNPKVRRGSAIDLDASVGGVLYEDLNVVGAVNRLCRHRARPFDCIQNWEKNLEAFFQYLAASYKKYLDSILFTWWPESAFEPESALFQLIFYHVDREGAIKVIGLKFLYRKAVVPELKGVPFETPSVSANALGNIAVFTEIRIGKNKDFDQFRREPLLKSFIIDKQPANGVTKMAALEFARRLILVTSENTSRIENSTYHVSPTCDCMAIEPQRGLQWISVK